MQFHYSLEKNALLLSERGIGFEEIIQAISAGQLLDIKNHSNLKYKNQKIMYVRVLYEVYVVPFVLESENTMFLKTIFPSRKARKYYLK